LTLHKLKDNQKPDAAVYRALLSACQKNQQHAKGLTLLDEMMMEMESHDGLFDAVSFTILAESCAKESDLKAANKLLSIWQREAHNPRARDNLRITTQPQRFRSMNAVYLMEAFAENKDLRAA